MSLANTIAIGIDVQQAQQYLQDLDEEFEEHTFDFDDIRHAIDYNDLVDELGEEPSAIIGEFPTGYFDNDTDEEDEDDSVKDSDFKILEEYSEPSNGSLPLDQSQNDDQFDHSEQILHNRLTGILTCVIFAPCIYRHANYSV